MTMVDNIIIEPYERPPGAEDESLTSEENEEKFDLKWL